MTARPPWDRSGRALGGRNAVFTVKMRQAIGFARKCLQRRHWRRLVVAALCGLPLAGCGEGGLAGGLRRAGVVTQPDEFRVLPTRPLELPPNLSELPAPAPGTTNRVAYRPRTDAIGALTGQPPAQAPGAPALVARVAAEAGAVDPAIRARLANEDVAYRRDNQPRLLERWAGRGQDRIVYGDMALDAEAELQRLRAAGVQVPDAPPLAE